MVAVNCTLCEFKNALTEMTHLLSKMWWMIVPSMVRWLYGVVLSHLINYFIMMTGWEVKGFVFEAEGRDKVVEKCHTIPGCYEFSTSGTRGEAGIRTQTGKPAYTKSTKASHFSYRTTTMPRLWSCWGNLEKVVACIRLIWLRIY